ncbi:hypothetical protein PINS_up015273 [Pythium insidiosum]|nr:hypothetical protein PINS_up015273 [Pythium insidiosum]
MREVETADEYISSVLKLQQEIRRTHSNLDDNWLSQIMLTNVIDVFPDISRKFLLELARGKGSPSLAEARWTITARDSIDQASGRRPQVARRQQQGGNQHLPFVSLVQDRAAADSV